MKHSFINKLFAFAALSISTCSLLSSCNKEDKVEPSPEMEKISVTVGVSTSLSTKATAINDEDEKNIKNLQIFVFRENGALDAYANSNEGSVSLSCTAGERTVYALVNAPSITTVSTLSAFLNSSSHLFDNDMDAFQMIGGLSSDLYAGAEIQIPVKRIVSRIRIEKISTDFTSDVYKNAVFTIDKVYLVNVAANTKLSDFALNNPTISAPTTWLNKKEYCYDLPQLLCDDSIDYTLPNKDQYTTVHTFYAYPNPTEEDSQDSTWNKRFTRLVIETTLDGVKYYYPISLQGLESNKTYTISNLTITRPGSSSADIPVTKAECTFSTKLADWVEAPLTAEEI